MNSIELHLVDLAKIAFDRLEISQPEIRNSSLYHVAKLYLEMAIELRYQRMNCNGFEAGIASIGEQGNIH